MTDQEVARQHLREMIAEMIRHGFKPTSIRMLPATAAKCGIELDKGGFGEFEGIRLKAGAL